MGKLHFRKLHKEWAVIERIFQALPTQIDTTTVAFIYKIEMAPRLSLRSGCPSRPALPCPVCTPPCLLYIVIILAVQTSLSFMGGVAQKVNN
jgi:hypothetical protein